MNECKWVRKHLADYSVGGMGRRARARVERHTLSCTSCGAELGALQRTGALVEAVGMESAPDHWPAVRAGLQTRSQRRAGPDLRPWPGRLAWASAMLAVGVGLLLYASVVRGPEQAKPDVTVKPPASAVAEQPVTTVTEADVELRPVVEDHLSAVWAAPLADEAAVGLGMGEPEEDG